jgi:hypothetical protein
MKAHGLCFTAKGTRRLCSTNSLSAHRPYSLLFIVLLQNSIGDRLLHHLVNLLQAVQYKYTTHQKGQGGWTAVQIYSSSLVANHAQEVMALLLVIFCLKVSGYHTINYTHDALGTNNEAAKTWFRVKFFAS